MTKRIETLNFMDILKGATPEQLAELKKALSVKAPSPLKTEVYRTEQGNLSIKANGRWLMVLQPNHWEELITLARTSLDNFADLELYTKKAK
jgi:hypothetical protein